MENQVLEKVFKEELIVLKATSGKLKIKDCPSLFEVHLDAKFKDLNKKQKPTKETKLVVYELKKDATFKEMYKSLQKDFKELCLTQHQIVEFFQKKKNYLQPKTLTFFLFQEGDDLFVASTHLKSDVLYILLDYFDDFIVWFANYHHRLVVPETDF